MRSPLTVEECLRRIEQTSNPDGFLGAPGSRGVIARVRGHRLRLRKRRWYAHSFAPMLYCTLEGRGGSTEVGCEGKIPLYPKAFAFVWFGTAIPLCTLLLVLGVVELARPSGAMSGSPFAFIAVSVVLLAGGFLLLYSGRRIGAREMPALRGYLRETLDANDAS